MHQKDRSDRFRELVKFISRSEIQQLRQEAKGVLALQRAQSSEITFIYE